MRSLKFFFAFCAVLLWGGAATASTILPAPVLVSTPGFDPITANGAFEVGRTPGAPPRGTQSSTPTVT